ncbi:hypothetical protein [Herbiconiux sp. L3-i23]|uniref:hypothetical protein n=1 Tax=Herbiconiux sp. L3-i23 TaxID=2905871 RepID=UPI00206F5917|nr:hypothetical protein [Herbiconiux sp. L3-i23]BDI22319.1 hypothetical protein L3i23_10950 [Herbiconiux sp. L3-i23]
MMPAESHRQHAERLADRFPELPVQRIMTMMAEEHDMLMGFDPDGVITPLVAEATLERVEMELARRQSEAAR